MELMSVFNQRKSVRSFTGEPISEETLQKLLHAANASPVGLAKYETLHLTVIKSKAILDEIEQNTARVFKAENRSFLYGAPELIIVSTSAVDNVGYSNAAIVAQDMSLAAVDENVGVCHIWGCMMVLTSNEELLAKLKIPNGFTPTCAIAVGKTKEVYANREIPDNRIAVHYI